MYPSNPVWYGRSHWAVEQLLRHPDFDDLNFTSLCPNTFTVSYLSDAVGWLKEYKRTGTQAPLELILDETAPVAMINPDDVGKVAATLLDLDDPSSHYGKSYVLAGPEDVCGRDVVKLVEGAVGIKVDKVSFRNTKMLQQFGEKGVIPMKFVSAMMNAMDGLWDGTSGLSHVSISPEIAELAPPKSTVEDAFHALVALV